ncbi:hypothetical protein G6M26_27625 [Agrobacterium tumefaciens]|nr:hypothetical protein [Agrobacterium tumefaciens]
MVLKIVITGIGRRKDRKAKLKRNNIAINNATLLLLRKIKNTFAKKLKYENLKELR